MLLNEIYNHRYGTDLADHAKDVLKRLEASGARDAGHGPELNELAEWIKEFEDESANPDGQRKINGGMDTAVGYAANRIHQCLANLGYEVSASTGAGGFQQRNREMWDQKQKADPLSRKIRGMRQDMNREPEEDEDDENERY